MFELSKVKVLHLEPTTTCQAACPQCPRTIFPDRLVKTELSLNDIKKLFPTDFVQQLDKMFMCGNFGEPAAAKDTLEIFKWFKEVNPDITLGMNTNGGVKHSTWWSELASVMTGPGDYVVFSIDGLSDTNDIYRVNVNWSSLIANASSFINAGGNAHWDMLVYRHNEHQVQQCIDLAKSMRFKWFRSKVTRREINTSVLQLPTSLNFKETSAGNIDCHALREQSIYVSAQGLVFPCCFVGENTVEPDFETSSHLSLDKINLHKNDLNSILLQFTKVTDTWNETPYVTCAKTCTACNNSSNFSNQWKNEIQL